MHPEHACQHSQRPAFHPAPALLSRTPIQQCRGWPRRVSYFGIRSIDQFIQHLTGQPVRGVVVGSVRFAVHRQTRRSDYTISTMQRVIGG
jgi:hypothetical protein